MVTGKVNIALILELFAEFRYFISSGVTVYPEAVGSILGVGRMTIRIDVKFSNNIFF